MPLVTVHHSDVTISAMAPQITGVSIVYSIVCSGADQTRHQRSASLAFVTGEFPAQKASNGENLQPQPPHQATLFSRVQIN